MNVRCIAPCMLFSHELVFHSLSPCDHRRQADNGQTEKTRHIECFVQRKRMCTCLTLT